MVKEKDTTKIVQLVAAPVGLLVEVDQGVEATETTEAVAPTYKHALAIGLNEDGGVTAITEDDLDVNVKL